MSWHDFFTLPHYTYSHNLAYAYGLVFAVQGGYLAWILRGWVRSGSQSGPQSGRQSGPRYK